MIMYNYLDNCSNSRANTCIKSKPSQTGKDATLYLYAHIHKYSKIYNTS